MLVHLTFLWGLLALAAVAAPAPAAARGRTPARPAAKKANPLLPVITFQNCGMIRDPLTRKSRSGELLLMDTITEVSKLVTLAQQSTKPTKRTGASSKAATKPRTGRTSKPVKRAGVPAKPPAGKQTTPGKTPNKTPFARLFKPTQRAAFTKALKSLQTPPKKAGNVIIYCNPDDAVPTTPLKKSPGAAWLRQDLGEFYAIGDTRKLTKVPGKEGSTEHPQCKRGDTYYIEPFTNRIHICKAFWKAAATIDKACPGPEASSNSLRAFHLMSALLETPFFGGKPNAPKAVKILKTLEARKPAGNAPSYAWAGVLQFREQKCPAKDATCPKGQKQNPKTGACDCPAGKKKNPKTDTCDCPPGKRPKKGKPDVCEKIPGKAAGQCKKGEQKVKGKCVPAAPVQCKKGQKKVGGKCVADKKPTAVQCKKGEKKVGGKCVATKPKPATDKKKQAAVAQKKKALAAKQQQLKAQKARRTAMAAEKKKAAMKKQTSKGKGKSGGKSGGGKKKTPKCKGKGAVGAACKFL
ncbi:hypothetical protein EDC01DRAFT_791673 [Geopyxis carbonaria]|nr:hypothetical protein EDC01DRAFT_791673 [Geopyxis carbonaria]